MSLQTSTVEKTLSMSNVGLATFKSTKITQPHHPQTLLGSGRVSQSDSFPIITTVVGCHHKQLTDDLSPSLTSLE